MRYPWGRTAVTRNIAAPAAALRAARDLSASGEPNLEYRIPEIVTEHGGSADDLDALVAAAGDVTGGGQAGATRKSAQGKDIRAGAELSWLDTPCGRLRVSTQGAHDWVSINPLRPNDLRVALTDLVELARGR